MLNAEEQEIGVMSMWNAEYRVHLKIAKCGGETRKSQKKRGISMQKLFKNAEETEKNAEKTEKRNSDAKCGMSLNNKRNTYV